MRNDKTNSYDKDAVSKYMTINGIAMESADFFHSIDDEKAFKGRGELTARGGTYVNKSLSFSDESEKGLKKGIAYSFKDLLEDAKKAAIETMDRTQEKIFPIAPTIAKDSEEPSCKFCSYRDICFRKVSDIRDVQGEIKEHLGSYTGKGDEEE